MPRPPFPIDWRSQIEACIIIALTLFAVFVWVSWREAQDYYSPEPCSDGLDGVRAVARTADLEVVAARLYGRSGGLTVYRVELSNGCVIVWRADGRGAVMDGEQPQTGYISLRPVHLLEGVF